MATIKCKVVAEKVWLSKECRMATTGDEVEFPAEVVDFTGKLVPFKVGPSFEVIADEKPSKGGKPKAGDDLV